jgi:hypothetical protein
MSELQVNKFAGIEITFGDLKEREEKGKKALQALIDRLEKIEASGDKSVHDRLTKLQQLKGHQEFDPVVDTVRKDIGGTVVRDGRAVHKGVKGNPEDNQELQVFAAIGMLLDDGRTTLDPELDLKTNKGFQQALAAVRGEFKARHDLFVNVYSILVEAAKVTDTGKAAAPAKAPAAAAPPAAKAPAAAVVVVAPPNPTSTIHAIDLARVTRELDGRGITFDDGYLPVYVRAILAEQVNGSGDGAGSSVPDIDLPDLETDADVEIVKDNLHAMQAIYFAATLEDLKFFQVMDKLVELFHQGMLPLGRGNAGFQIYKYWKKSSDRMTEVERRNLYARAFGFPGGDVSTGSPNREFQDLWFRFVSAVSEFNRQVSVDQLLRSPIPFGVSAEQARKSGRDLAANLSLYGYGVAFFAATDLRDQIREILDIYRDEELRSAYGARDAFQVIDQVATLELGGARNSVRQRTMATAGATIIRWLARNIDKLTSIGHGLFVDPSPNGYDRKHQPMMEPTDRDLIDACEQWLAVTGTSDQRVEEYAQPSEGPNMTSRPIQIPGVARDLLDSVGVTPLQAVR